MKTIVLGPPGTGKTTTLLNEVDKYLKETDPNRIGYFSFTQKAAYEARNRAMSKFNYSEDDLPNAKDIYGISKSLGESIYHHNLVIRTSTIGHEINTKHGLLEWFISQNSYCTGYRNAYFSGITTLELANLINDFILKKLNLIGLFNVSSEKISKYELLSKINEIYKLKKKIIISDQQKIDRSLNSYKFNRVFGYYPNSWDKMIVSMYKDWCHKY